MQLIIKRKFSSSAWKAQLVTVNTGWKLTLHTWGRLKQKPGRAWKGHFYFYFHSNLRKTGRAICKRCSTNYLWGMAGDVQTTNSLMWNDSIYFHDIVPMWSAASHSFTCLTSSRVMHYWCKSGIFFFKFAFSGHNKISVFQIWKFQMGNSVCPCQCDFLQTVVLSNVLSSVCINVCILK